MLTQSWDVHPRSLIRPVTRSLDAWPKPEFVAIPSAKAAEDLFKELPAMRLMCQ